ncbi:hypothetical protein ACLB2K_046140 [Fragaria x ananassa]
MQQAVIHSRPTPAHEIEKLGPPLSVAVAETISLTSLSLNGTDVVVPNDIQSNSEMSNKDASKDELQHEMPHSNLQNNGIRYDKLSAENLIGVEFVTVEAAETFYYDYAKEMGFDVRKDDMRTSTRTGRVTIRKWACSAEGERQEKHTDINNKVRMPKKLTRCHCPCLFKIRYFKKNNSYIVVDFRTDHSHDLVQPHESHLLRSHRSVLDSDLALAKSMRRASIKTCHAYEYMVDVSGGYANVGFTLKDLYNRLDASQREDMIGGDANATLGYLKGKAAEDKKLFYKYSTDENKRSAN